MAQTHKPFPALLILAAFSRHDDALDWARNRAVAEFGPLLMESPRFSFDNTSYYEPTMGAGLKKVFYVFDNQFDLDSLADLKLATNHWEEEYAQASDHPEPRPLNLDPGYMQLSKLVLASAKDHAHRVYLGKGIYAEVTLSYHRDTHWQPAGDWTFADYRREDFHRFFMQCRDYLHDKQRKEAAE